MLFMCIFFFFKQKTAYEMRISDWSSDVCSSDLTDTALQRGGKITLRRGHRPAARLAGATRRGACAGECIQRARQAHPRGQLHRIAIAPTDSENRAAPER